MQVTQTVVNTRDCPPGERLEFWCEALSSLGERDIRTEHRSDFDATIQMIDLGAVGLSIFRNPSMETRRTAKMLRQCDPKIYSLNLTLRGHGSIHQGRNGCVAHRDEFNILDLSRPHHARYVEDRVGGADSSTAISIQIPHTLLPIPANKARQLDAVGMMSGRTGVGALLAHHLRQLPRHIDELQPVDVARVGTVTLDLAAAMLVHHLGFEASVLPPETRQQVTHTHVQAFIDRHLADPELTPQAIAAAHHISLRTLHRLFQSSGTTVATSIRQRRLDRCRRDLVDPALHGQSIQTIARRWGLLDNAHFSRAFSAVHGMSPRAYRHHHESRQTDGTVAAAALPTPTTHDGSVTEATARVIKR
ncbi:helix-turn-helix domain-containing protein [Micromonospora sp. NPDC050187]|uniref:AraC-like ligand-binding domain-containing protein n=1 Tax=Micromonospora sp. NPDC050187 TaxID=3364277 RepID=UPI0037A6B32F